MQGIEMDKLTNDVRVEMYRSFIEAGRAPDKWQIAGRLGVDVNDVASAVRELASLDVIALVPGTDLIWLAHPFCALDAPFVVAANGRSWDAICIWDALGILAVLESDGQVRCHCPDCGEALTLTVESERLQTTEDYVVHYGVPARLWYEDVGYT